MSSVPRAEFIENVAVFRSGIVTLTDAVKFRFRDGSPNSITVDTLVQFCLPKRGVDGQEPGLQNTVQRCVAEPVWAVPSNPYPVRIFVL